LQTDRRWQQMRSDAEFQAMLHMAARDAALLEELEALFPEDAAYLKNVAQHQPLPQGEGL
jgi:hypothetical protein